MTMSKSVARMRIARELQSAESALNDALLKQSSLFTTMVAARRDTEVEPFTGQDALLRLARSQQSLLSAGGDLARIHGKMLDISEKIVGFDECPDELKPMGQLENQDLAV